MNLKKLLTFTGAATLAVMPVATAQNPTILQGSYVSNVFGQSNFVKNPNAQTNTANVTLTTATATRSTTTPLVATTEWNVTITSANGTAAWATRTFDAGMKNQNCEARFTYRGFQATSKAQIKQGANVVAELVLTPSATDPRIASINFPCGDLSSATTFVITDTATLAGTNEIGGIYVGLATNQANVAQAEVVVQAGRNTTQTMSSAAYTDIVWSSESLDVNNEFNTTTGIFSPKKAGYYNFDAAILFDSATWGAGDYANLQAVKNSSIIEISGDYFPDRTYYMNLRLSGAVYLNAGDTLKFQIYNGSASNKLIVGNVAWNFLVIKRFPSSSELVVTPETQNVWGGVAYRSSSQTLLSGTPSVTGYSQFNNAVWNQPTLLQGKAQVTTTDSGNNLGFSIPNLPVGNYKLEISGQLYAQPGSITVNDTTLCTFRILETTTTTTIAEQAIQGGRPTSATNTANVTNSFQGVFNNTSVATRNFRLEANKTYDNNATNLGKCIATSSAAGNTDATIISFTITPLDNNANSALYVQGPVKAAGTGTAIQEPYQGFLGGTLISQTGGSTYSERAAFAPTTAITYQTAVSMTLNAGLYWCSFNSSVSAASDTNWYSKVSINGAAAPGLNWGTSDLITKISAGDYTNKQISLPIYLTTTKTVGWSHRTSVANASAGYHEMWCMRMN